MVSYSTIGKGLRGFKNKEVAKKAGEAAGRQKRMESLARLIEQKRQAEANGDTAKAEKLKNQLAKKLSADAPAGRIKTTTDDFLGSK